MYQNYEPLVTKLTIPAELQRSVDWLKAHGAKVDPIYGLELAAGSTSTATISTITWIDPATGAFYHALLPPFGASDDSVSIALAEMMAKGLATGPFERYSSALPPVAEPKPIDDVVGIPDPHFAGQFQPGPKANMLGAWNAYQSMGMDYTASDGKRYRPIPISGGPMPAWNWVLA